MKRLLILLSFVFMLSPFQMAAQVFLDLETGGVFSGYNNIRIPGDSGTLFSLSRDLSTKPSIFYRIRIGFTFKERNHVSVLYAPLTLKATGQVNKEIIFLKKLFPPPSLLKGSSPSIPTE